MLLLVLLPIIGTASEFSADEGAAISQAVSLERGDGWTFAHPFPAADPTGDAFPLTLSTRAGDRFAPFANHPTYPAMLAGASRVAGRAGMVALSIAGTVAAAVLTALLARRIDRSLAVPAFWVAGIASPLFFDSYVVIAHTIGAACAAGAVLCTLRIIERPQQRVWYLALLMTAAAGAMMRREMLFFAAALAVAVVIAGRRRGSIQWRLAAAPIVGAASGWLLDRALLELVVSGSTGSTQWQPSADTGGFVANRVIAFVITWLLPSYSLEAGDAVLLLAVAAGAVAAYIARTRPSDSAGVRLFAVVAGAGGVVRLLLGPGPVPGLLVAFPLLAIGVAALGRRPLPTDAARLYAVTFGLFSIAVLATQYPTGGSGEWGGRYFAIGLPLIVPLLVYGVREAGHRLDRSTAVIATAAVVALSLAMAALGVVTLRHFHRETDAMVAAVAASVRAHPASDDGKPVVVSSHGAAGRLAFTLLDGTRWLSVPVDQLETYGRRLRELSVGTITFVTRDEKDMLRLDALYQVEDERHAGDWIVVALRPR